MVYAYDDFKIDKPFGALRWGVGDVGSHRQPKNSLYRVRFGIFYGKVDVWRPLIFCTTLKKVTSGR